MSSTRTAGGIAALGVAGLLSFGLYVVLARLAPGNGWHDTLSFLLVMAALYAMYAVSFATASQLNGPRTSAVILCAGVLFRLALVPAGLPRDTPAGDVLPLLASDLAGRAVVFERQLLFDDDHWRYLWDGHVGAQGIDPRALPPEDGRLDALAAEAVWEEIRGNVNHPWLTTIYAPVAQAWFRVLHALAPGSVVALKLSWIAADLLAMILVSRSVVRLRRPPSLLLLYAWNPLLIKVTAGSAHFDVLVALGVAVLTYGLVRSQRLLIAIGWIIAVAVKLTPLVFLLAVARRLRTTWSGAAVALIAILLAPMITSVSSGSGGDAFLHDWEFNATFFHAFKLLFAWSDAPSTWARVTVACTVIAAGWWAARRFEATDIDAFARAALIPMAVLLLCGPVLMPWYLVWVLPLAAVTRTLFWFQLTAVVQLAFLVMVDGRERAPVLWIEALLMLLLAARWLRQCRRSRQDAAVAA